MTIAPGSRLGPYEIVSRIGAGGMGEVWRARDTRLEREVAIKVLPAALAHDPQFRARFEREAKTISQLNHPHICQIYDVGQSDASGGATSYIVMELLEGESLADRLARGPLPLAEVFRYGTQIAEALTAAHRAGIIHRDLKPGNIMLTKSGAKLLDFGLAKGAQSPLQFDGTGATEHKPLTEKGTILGTFQYMAPEQLEGDEADARTDIFAFGAVLYEMVTGKRAFEGKTKTSLIAAIVDRDPPPISTLRPLTPASLEHVIARCLAKNPDERWQTARDAGEELRWIGGADSQASITLQGHGLRRTKRSFLPVASGLLLLAAIASGLLLVRERTQLSRARETIQFQFFAPAESSLALSAGLVSPDGRVIAIVVRKHGESAIWIRRLDSSVPQLIPGTEAATFPFWSPDSLQLGFFADGKLKKTSLSGGAPQVLCDASAGRGGSWNADGVILFAPAPTGPLQRVSASGGVPVAVLALDAKQKEASQRWPFFLPDDKHFLYSSREGSSAGVYLASLDGRMRKRLTDADSSAAYIKGLVLYVRGATLFAQKLDLKAGTLTGEPLTVSENVGHESSFGKSAFSVSNDVLAFRTGTAGNYQLTWLDRSGRVTGTIGPLGSYEHPDVSPDGKFVAVDRTERAGAKDVWVIDSARGTMSRLTFDVTHDWIPAWSPDGQTIAFISDRDGAGGLFAKRSNGAHLEKKLIQSQVRLHHFDWSSDGRLLATEQIRDKGMDIWIYELATGKARAVVKTDFADSNPRLSPDGRSLAYTSEETARPEIYALSLAADGGRWQISTEGGIGPRWRADGRELFFFSRGKMMSAAISAGETFEAGVPQPLFEPKLNYNEHGYDVSSDGQRFLMPMLTERATSAPVNVVMHWSKVLER